MNLRTGIFRKAGIESEAAPGTTMTWMVSILFIVLVGLTLDLAWTGFIFELDGNGRYAAYLTSALILTSLLLSAIRLSPVIEWFLLLVCVGLLTLPAWAGLVFAVVAFQLARTARGVFLVSVLLFVAGFVSQALQIYGFGGDTLLALLQTHASESMDFVLTTFRVRFVVAFSVQVALLACFRRSAQTRVPSLRFSSALLGFAISSAVAVMTVAPARDALKFVRQSPSFAEPVPFIAQPSRDVDVVLLLGESTSRWHLQLYGYPYPTTPRLSARSDELIALTDAVSVYSHTMQSVSSLMYRQGEGQVGANVTLLGKLKAAHVRSTWYSSQASHGPWDSPVRWLAREASSTRYFADAGLVLPRGLDYELQLGDGFTADRDLADAVVIDLAKDQRGPSMTVAHLTAGHFDYCRHIPHDVRKRFEGVKRGTKYFGNAPDRTAQVNCYDAAMTMVDEVVDRIVETAKRRARPTVIVFAPDHGEDPDGGTGHSSTVHSARHVEIPVVLFFNESARQALPKEYSRLQANRTKPFALPWLHESILDLFGLGDQFNQEPGRSIFAEDYLPSRRSLFPDSGAMFYDELTPGDRKDYLSKARLALRELSQTRANAPLIFAHRNNSELALLESMQSFAGAEMDVVFDAKTRRFHVYHPPAEPTGYTLERALEISGSKPSLMFWLDWKNANEDNIALAVEELERLNRLFDIKQRTLVETFIVNGVDGDLLSKRGFRHSYYLQPQPAEMNACAQAMTSPACVAAVSQSARDAKRMHVSYISFDRSLASFANGVLEIAPELKTLTWDLSIDASKPGIGRQLLGSPAVEVELIRLHSRFWR